MSALLIASGLVMAVLVGGVWLWDRRKAGSVPLDGTPAVPKIKTSLSDEIIELLEEGVLLLNDSLTTIKANRAARILLGTGDVLPPRLPSEDLLSIARRVLVEQREVEDVIELRSPSRRSLQVRGSFLDDSGVIVLLLRDISDDQRSQRIRRQFVMHASHELKTPIAGILLLAEAVSDASANDPEKTRHFAASLLRESQRLNRLVADLLDLSRLEDPATIANSIADLSVVVQTEMTEALPQANARSITVTSSIQDGVMVRGDEAQLALMVRNLFDNAIRYTAQQGEISLSVQAEKGEAIVRITDTGVGIPLRDQARVFERFYRVDKGRSRDQGGTGLGLAIVKHVADLHGGHVWVASQLGEGSTFTVSLPLTQDRAQDGQRLPGEAI
jgi:two-component system sensor histidine kinase SenX3